MVIARSGAIISTHVPKEANEMKHNLFTSLCTVTFICAYFS